MSVSTSTTARISAAADTQGATILTDTSTVASPIKNDESTVSPDPQEAPKIDKLPKEQKLDTQRHSIDNLSSLVGVDLKDFECSENTLQKIIELKIQQEKTIAAKLKHSNLTLSLKLLDSAVAANIPSSMIPHMFFDEESYKRDALSSLENKTSKKDQMKNSVYNLPQVKSTRSSLSLVQDNDITQRKQIIPSPGSSLSNKEKQKSKVDLRQYKGHNRSRTMSSINQQAISTGVFKVNLNQPVSSNLEFHHWPVPVDVNNASRELQKSIETSNSEKRDGMLSPQTGSQTAGTHPQPSEQPPKKKRKNSKSSVSSSLSKSGRKAHKRSQSEIVSGNLGSPYIYRDASPQRGGGSRGGPFPDRVLPEHTSGHYGPPSAYGQLIYRSHQQGAIPPHLPLLTSLPPPPPPPPSIPHPQSAGVSPYGINAERASIYYHDLPHQIHYNPPFLTPRNDSTKKEEYVNLNTPQHGYYRQK
ncbi:hypothetical protein DAMA08_010480 [Martiniozyma asiatica (nom. inval.)]|nr:hypothetical protein DAMA08_010480 [Martiniozyma asiatica]